MDKWKVFALVMISLLIIAAGIRVVYVETHQFTLNEEQNALVIKAAENGLKDEIGGKDYNITVANSGGVISTSYGEKKVAFVVYTYGNTTISALVDIETGEIVKKSRVEYAGWMTEYKRPERRAHKWLFK